MPAVRKALTMQDEKKLGATERKRRGARIGMKPERKAETRKAQSGETAPTLKRWRYAEKPIEIIG